MKAIMDTHVLIWWCDDPSTLDEEARSIISDGRNTLYVSVATIWEITIKKSLGKLTIKGDLAAAIEQNRLEYLPIQPLHAWRISELPPIHTDPFDRILIAQALCENCRLITRDRFISSYPVKCILA